MAIAVVFVLSETENIPLLFEVKQQLFLCKLIFRLTTSCEVLEDLSTGFSAFCFVTFFAQEEILSDF